MSRSVWRAAAGGDRGRRRSAAGAAGSLAALEVVGLWAEALRVGRAEDRAAGAGIGLAALLLIGGLDRAPRRRA
ncbi:MAG TPA: hypothetical protein VNK05_12110 [Chloroflexota bacterium]|jgi:hypothetical protein|nr:hypothetical protein [Chloroflexota bacterium]